MKFSRALCAAALVCAVLAPAAIAGANTPKYPEHDFDTNGDGKIDLRIYDTNNDGIFEWPTGSKTFKGDLDIDVPVVMHGSVGIAADDVFFDAPVTTAPGAPLTGLALTAKSQFGIVLLSSPLDITDTGTFSMYAPDFVSIDTGSDAGASIHAKTITMTSLTSTVYVNNFAVDDNFNPLIDQHLNADTINLIAKGKDGGVEVTGSSLEARAVNVEATNSNAEFADFNISDSVVTTNPARTGRVGSPGNVLLEGEGLPNQITNADIDSGKNVVLKSFVKLAPFCITSGSLTANAGKGTIDVSGVRGGTSLVGDPAPVLTGKVYGKTNTGSEFCS